VEAAFVVRFGGSLNASGRGIGSQYVAAPADGLGVQLKYQNCRQETSQESKQPGMLESPVSSQCSLSPGKDAPDCGIVLPSEGSFTFLTEI
jgi:hypothetical protein